MENKRKENTLKLLYYIIGIKIAGFGFIVSKLIDLEYDKINYFLIVGLFLLIISIVISLMFIFSNIFGYEKEKISNKLVKRLLSFLGMIIGAVFACIICWILLYKNYITL
tara:strand:- start:1465 stop:1794 length:330 start_codon:yes stop_codon:yes gene_type:complete